MARLPLVLLCLLCTLWPNAAARADYYPSGAYTVVSDVTLPAAGLLIRTGTAVLGGAQVYQVTGSTVYMMAFDSTTQPVNGTAALWQSASCASNTICQMNLVPAGGVKATSGLYVILSTTGTTLTAQGFPAGYYAVAYK